MQSFVTGFFHLAQCFQGSFMSGHMSVTSFLVRFHREDVPLVVGSSADGTLSRFHIGANMNNAACVQIFVWTHVFCSLGCIHRGRIVESYGNSNLLKNCQAIFQSGCTIF